MAYSKKQLSEFKATIIKEVSGGKSLHATLKGNDKLPSNTTVFNWLKEDHADYDKDFFDNYAYAKELRTNRIFEEILEISDKQGADVIIVEGKEVVNHNVINRNRLQVDARKWVLGRMNPKKYGDKLDLTTKDKPINATEIKTTIIFKGKKNK